MKKVVCQNCGNKFDYHMYVGLCPKCGKIYRTRSEHVEHNSGIVLNATYSTEDIHPELEAYWNHSFAPGNFGYQNVYPEQMYQKTQLNKADRPPQAMIRTTRPQQNQASSAGAIAFIIIMLTIFMILIALISSYQ